MKKALVLTHGFGGSKKEFKSLVANISDKINHEIIYFEYKERYGNISLKKLAKRLEKKVESLFDIYDDISLLGFSQGGIISAICFECLRTNHTNLKKCICISSPFKGSLLAYSLPFIGAKELRFSSSLLEDVRLGIFKKPDPYFIVYNPFDLMIFPGMHTYISGTKSMKVCSLIHPQVLAKKRLAKSVANFLK